MKLKAKLETCPTCGKGRLHPTIIHQEFKISRQHVVVHDIRVDACDNCEEQVIDGAEMQRAKDIAKQLASQKRATG